MSWSRNKAVETVWGLVGWGQKILYHTYISKG